MLNETKYIKQTSNKGNSRGAKPLFFQPKLTINQPNDVYEQEADAMADRVMRMPDRSENNWFFSPVASRVQGKCAHCEIEENKLQRKESSGRTAEASGKVASYISSLSSKGSPLPDSARRFFEPRFKHDFSAVKVHTDADAAKSSQSIQALAYTAGNNIVFNQSQFAPESYSGKKLLAHELAHVRQQEASNVTSETSGMDYAHNKTNKIQRRISADFSVIRDRLSRGVFDWAVTDGDAHAVLLLLKQLNTDDLRDTIAAMESSNIVDTFFENLSDADVTHEAEFLQQVQNNRTNSHTRRDGNSTATVSSTFSCTLEQGNILYRSITTAQNWLDSAIARLGEYTAAPGAPGMAGIRDALQAHVHSVNPAHINLLLTRLQAFKNQMFSASNLEVDCAAPSDGLCREIAAAYVERGSPQKMRFCSRFFSSNETWRIEALIHEAMHAFLPNSNSGGDTVTDRAYAHERVYEFLSPEEAFDNSDSIAMLVQVLAQGRAVTSRDMHRPQDNFSDCSAEQLQMLRPAIARAARWNLNAINVLADTRADFRSGYATLRSQYFSSDRVELIPSLLEPYQESRSKFADDLSIECETTGSACSSGTYGYYRSFIFRSGTLHVCPVFFTMSEEDKIKSFLSLTIMNSTGKSDAESARYASFAEALTAKYWGSAPPL